MPPGRLERNIRNALAAALRHWNWKAALLGSLFRANIFFTANLTAGSHAALSAALTEAAYRVVLSGLYGSLIQRARRWNPAWAAGVVLPVFAHSVELVVHRLRGTPNLRASLIASVSFTVVSTLFNLYAMRRGALLVGEGGQAMRTDLARMPALAIGFLRSAVAMPIQLIKNLF